MDSDDSIIERRNKSLRKIQSKRFRFIVAILIFILGCFFSLSVASIVLMNEPHFNQCIGNYNGISFSYDLWLEIYGVTNIGVLCMIGLFGTRLYFQSLLKNKCNFAGICLIIFLIISYLFQFCWYIVGGILFFTEVEPHCEKGKTIYELGWVMFALQTLVWFAGCCYIKVLLQ